MTKIFKTKQGSILYYDGERKLLYVQTKEALSDIMASLNEDAKSINPVDRMCAQDILADIEKLGITTQVFQECSPCAYLYTPRFLTLCFGIKTIGDTGETEFSITKRLRLCLNLLLFHLFVFLFVMLLIEFTYVTSRTKLTNSRKKSKHLKIKKIKIKYDTKH